MSESQNDHDHDADRDTDRDRRPGEVSDADLPEDVRPDEDNPLARHPEETGDQDDVIGGDVEGEPERAPLTEADADYGSGSRDG